MLRLARARALRATPRAAAATREALLLANGTACSSNSLMRLRAASSSPAAQRKGACRGDAITRYQHFLSHLWLALRTFSRVGLLRGRCVMIMYRCLGLNRASTLCWLGR